MQKGLVVHNEPLCVSQFLRESLPPPSSSSSSSLLRRCLLLCGSWAPQMRRNGKWSATAAFKAFPLPLPESFFCFFHVLLQQVLKRKRKRLKKKKNLKQKHQKLNGALSRHHAECFFFFFNCPPPLAKTWSSGLLTQPNSSIANVTFASLHQKDSYVSERQSNMDAVLGPSQ